MTVAGGDRVRLTPDTAQDFHRLAARITTP